VPGIAQETQVNHKPTLDEVAQLIIETLKLEELGVEDIDPDAPLFGEGLGLDSIDALELALAVSQRYGVKISSEDPNVQQIFGSLRNLTNHISANNSN
jgi:acyl carrier protein